MQYTNINKQTSSEEDKSAVDWIFAVFRRWKVFSVFFILTILPGSYRVYNKTISQIPIYRSSTEIMMAPAAFEVKTKTGDVIERRYTVRDEVILMRSKPVIEKAALLLKEKYNYAEDTELLERYISRSTGIRGAGGRENVSQSLVVISTTSEDPQRAYDYISAVLEAYKLQKEHEEKSFFEKTFITFQDQIGFAYESLLEAENVLADFIIANEDIIILVERYKLFPDIESKVIISSVLNEKLLNTRDSISSLKRFIDTADNMLLQDPLSAMLYIAREYPHLIDSGLRNSFFEMESRLDDALQSVQEVHPRAVQLRSQLNIILEKIRQNISSALIEIKAELYGLEKQEQELSSLAQEEFYKKIITYSMLKKSIVINSEIYNNLSKTLQEIDLGEKLRHYADFRVISPHAVPSAPVKSNSTNMFLMLFLFSIAIGYGAVYIAEILDTRIRDIEQLQSIVDLPVLAMIPFYRPTKFTKLLGEKDIKKKILVLSDALSPAAEATRCLRTNILFLNQGDCKIIGITSAVPREGKTFLISNTAALTAQSGKKTLLIDCDIRKHGLSNMWGVQHAKGISDLLSGDNPLLLEEGYLMDVGVKNLRILPAGMARANPSEQLGSVSMDKVLSAARQLFDIVYVDVPPVLAVTDPVIMAKKMDALIFVAAAYHANKKSVERAYKMLKEVGANIIGTVFNKIDAGVFGYYKYKYTYGDQSGYYSDKIKS